MVTWRQHSGNFENPINPEYEQEARLVEQARAGSERAFSALLARYQQPVFRLIYYLVGQEEDARDLARIALKHALLHMPRVPAGFSIRPWLLRVAVLVALDAVRERSESPQQLLEALRLPGPLQTPKIVDADPTMDDTMVLGVAVRHLAQNPANAIADAWDALPLEIERELIRRLLSGLPEGDAELLALGVVGQVPTRDLAALAGTSQRSIRRRIARALILFQGRYHEMRLEALPPGPAAPELSRTAGISPLEAARRGLALASERVRRGFQGAQVETTMEAQERLETLRQSDIPAAAASVVSPVPAQVDAQMSPAPPPVIVVARDLTSADTIVTPASAELLGLAGTFATTSWESWTAPTLEPETVELATVALPVIATEAVPPTVHDMPTEVLATTDLDHNHLEATPAETFFAEPLNSLAAEAPLALTTLLGGDPGATMVAARFTLAEHDDQQHAELSGQTGPLALPETAEPVTGSAAGRRDEAGAMDDTALLVAPATLAEPAAEHTFAAPSPTVDEAAAAPAEHAPAAPLEMADQETAAAFAQANDASAPLLAADAAALTSPARAAEAAAPPVLLVPTAAPGNAEPAVGRDVPAPPADAPLEVATPFSAATFVAEPQVAPTSAALLVTVAALAETPTSEGAMLAEPLASRPIAEQPSVNEQEADEADEAQVPVPAPRADDAERATVAHDAEPVLMEPSAAAITREPLLDEPTFVESPPPDAALALAAAPAVAALTEFAIAPGADRADVDDPTPVMVAEEAQAAPDEPAALVTMLSADAGGSTTPEDETPLVEPRAQDTPSAPAAVEPVVANVPDEPGRAEPMLAEQPFLEEIPEEGSAAPNSFADSDDSSALDGSAFAEQTMIAEMETEHPLSAQGSGNEAADEVPVRGAMQAAEAVAAATPFAMEEAPGAEEVPLAESDPHAGAAPASSAPEPTPATLPQRSGNTVVMPPTQRADYMARHQAAWVEAGDLNGFAGVQLVVVSEEDSAEFAAPSVPANGVHMMGEPADSSAAQALAPNHFATDATAAGPVTFDLADLAGLAHLASAGVTDAGGALVPEVTSIPEDSAGSTAVSTSESTPAIANTDLSTPAATETPPGLRTRTPTRPMPRLERDITDPPHEW